MKALAQLVLKIAGWKVVGGYPANTPKSVMIAAPHTSNWDLLYARAAFFIMGVPVRYTIKKEVMVGPLGWFLKKLGAIAIDRKRKVSGKQMTYVENMVQMLKERDELVIMITPEGTRSYAKRWKSGFYHIALEAGVPIILGYLDYKKKHAGIGPVFHPTGDYEKDLEEIQSFYRGVTAKYPEKGVR